MRTTKTKIFEISELVLDNELYPRNAMDWITSLRYSEAMKSGAKFPSIVVALCSGDGKNYVVDGFHRIDALKKLKQTHTQCEFLGELSRKEIYIEAIKRNNAHGKQFSSQERTRIIITLEKWNLSQEAISHLVAIPISELEPFIAKRMTRIGSEDVALKSPLRHLAGTEMTNVSAQQPLANRNQIQLLDGLLALLRNDWIDFGSELVREKLFNILQLLKPLEKRLKMKVKK